MYYNLFKIGIHCRLKIGIHIWYYRYAIPKDVKGGRFKVFQGKFSLKVTKVTRLLCCKPTFKSAYAHSSYICVHGYIVCIKGEWL